MKHVLITGVSRGIGRGLAQHYLDSGNRVFGSVRRLEDADELQQRYGEAFRPLLFDVGDADAVRRAADELAETVDALDVLINCAGISPREKGRGIADIDEAAVAKAFDVNVLGPVRVLKAFLPLLEAGSSPRAVMISSVLGSIGLTTGGGGIPYGVSKAALNMMTRQLSLRLHTLEIPIAAVHPGWVKTDMGTAAAPLSVEESVRGIVRVIDSLTLKSPMFLDYQGKELPW